MTAATPGNPFSGQRTRTTSGQPQRVFVNSSNQVSRPPVLFRMPSVKNETTSIPEGSLETLAESPTSAEHLSQTSRRATADSKLAVGNKSPLRAPHFSIAPSDRPEQSRPDQNPKNSPSPILKPDPVAVKAVEVLVSSGESELEKAQERTSKSRPASIPPVAPLPTSKSWMEIIGSRVVILLLIGAITAIAFFANRQPVLDNDDSLTTIQLDSMDKEESARSAADLATSKTEMVPASTPDAAKSPQPASGASPTSTGNTVKVEAVEPTFDIAMLNAPLVTSSGNQPTAESASPKLNQPRITVAASPASSPISTSNNPPANNPPANNSPSGNAPVNNPLSNNASLQSPNSLGDSGSSPSSASGDWRDDLRSMEWMANSQPSRGALNSQSEPVIQQNQPAYNPSPVRSNSWANSQPTSATGDYPTDSGRLGASSGGNAISPDDAIRAVIDAAIVAPMNVDAGYPTTSQPQGVPDWRRYLPTDPNSGAGIYSPTVPGFPADAYPSTNYPTNTFPGYNAPNYNGGTTPLVPANSMNPPAGQGAEAQRGFSALPGQSQFYGNSQYNGNTVNGNGFNGNAIPSTQPLPPGYMFSNGVASPASYGTGAAGYAPTNFGFEGQTGMDSSPGMIGQ